MPKVTKKKSADVPRELEDMLRGKYLKAGLSKRRSGPIKTFEGCVLALGHFDFHGAATPMRVATIDWEADNNRPCEGITVPVLEDEKWEILKEAFRGTGRIRTYHFTSPSGSAWRADFSNVVALRCECEECDCK